MSSRLTPHISNGLWSSSPAPQRSPSVRHAPGFVSASLHRSLDGTKVTMYAQWRSVEDYQAMRQDPTPLPFLQEALALATFEPGMYEVVQTFAPLGEEA
jgi:quinol monooxygenase YgiN